MKSKLGNVDLESFYSRVDSVADRIAKSHGPRLKCGLGCASCCVDGITVFRIEAENIAERHAELFEKDKAHPPGACAFLDDNSSCRIYKDRPYVCRTQGLPLRWLEDYFDETIEYRDICPVNEEGPAVEDLDAADCFTLGPFEEELARLQESSGPADRIALRDLFG